MEAQPIIHLNGFPGTGKLTIARDLQIMLDHRPTEDELSNHQPATAAKLVHNHLLIDPANAVLHRTQPGYHKLRKALRDAIFESLVTEESTYGTTCTFTDCQSGDEIGIQACEDFQTMAKARGCHFIPIIITCDRDENIRRLGGAGRSTWSKITDVELLMQCRQQVSPPPIYDFHGHGARYELDVIDLSAEQAASAILMHVSKYIIWR